MIRGVARNDPRLCHEVFEWPLRDLLLVYLEKLKEQARRWYEVEVLVWSALAPHQKKKTDPPAVPRVLRGS